MTHTIIAIQRFDRGLQIVDASGRQFLVSDASMLWKTLLEICDDPDLPKAQVQKPENQYVGLAATVAKRFMPHHSETLDKVTPVASQVIDILSDHVSRRRSRPPSSDKKKRKSRSVRGNP